MPIERPDEKKAPIQEPPNGDPVDEGFDKTVYAEDPESADALVAAQDLDDEEALNPPVGVAGGTASRADLDARASKAGRTPDRKTAADAANDAREIGERKSRRSP
jgi:hypothetical protein